MKRKTVFAVGVTSLIGKELVKVLITSVNMKNHSLGQTVIGELLVQESNQ